MTSSDFINLRKQAQYIDQKLQYLDLKLVYPDRIYQSDKVLYSEKKLEAVISENKNILQSVDEEIDIAEHNIQQIESFLTDTNRDTLQIMNEIKNMEDLLIPYGYTPMLNSSETSQQEKESDTSIATETSGDDVEVCTEEIAKIFIVENNETKTQEEEFKPRTLIRNHSEPPSEPLFSKHYYLALGLPIPQQLLLSESQMNGSC